MEMKNITLSSKLAINEDEEKFYLIPSSLTHITNDKLICLLEREANKLLQLLLPYRCLCLILADYQLQYQIGRGRYSQKNVIRRAKTIHLQSPEYHEICWYIVIFKVFFSKNLFWEFNIKESM